jgi:hypothetical protein
MKTKLSALLLGAGLLAGCVVDSEQPFYRADDLVFDQRLLGEWRTQAEPGEQPGDSFRIEREGKQGYVARVKSADDKEEFIELRLFKLGTRTYADHRMRQADGSTGRHQLSRIDEIGETWKLSGLSHGWMRDHLRANPKALAHRFDDGDNKENPPVTLTATTAELQAFILKHGDAPGFFGETSTFERVQPTKAAK